MGMFTVNNAELIAAANEYKTSCETYAQQMEELKNGLNAVTEKWKDEVAEVWANLVPETITDLEKIKTNLAYHASLLKEVAKKASETQASIKSEINKLYLT